MNSLVHIPLQSEATLRRFMDLWVVQLLFMGMSFVLGRSLMWAQKDTYRDQAYRVRGAVQAATLRIETRRNNADVLKTWVGEGIPTWQRKMARVWNCFLSRFIKSVVLGHSGKPVFSARSRTIVHALSWGGLFTKAPP